METRIKVVQLEKGKGHCLSIEENPDWDLLIVLSNEGFAVKKVDLPKGYEQVHDHFNKKETPEEIARRLEIEAEGDKKRIMQIAQIAEFNALVKLLEGVKQTKGGYKVSKLSVSYENLIEGQHCICGWVTTDEGATILQTWSKDGTRSIREYDSDKMNLLF